MGDYKSLTVFQKAHALACEIHRVTNLVPPRERFGLMDQIRKASTSIGANLAEGCGRNDDGELAHHVGIALGSANELNYLLELATDTATFDEKTTEPWRAALVDVRKMLAGLSHSAQADRRSTRRASPRPRSPRTNGGSTTGETASPESADEAVDPATA